MLFELDVGATSPFIWLIIWDPADSHIELKNNGCDIFWEENRNIEIINNPKKSNRKIIDQ